MPPLGRVKASRSSSARDHNIVWLKIQNEIKLANEIEELSRIEHLSNAIRV